MGRCLFGGWPLAVFRKSLLFRDFRRRERGCRYPDQRGLKVLWPPACSPPSNPLWPFTKVKELVAVMLAKPQKEAEEDATQKAFCDKEMKDTRAKKDDKTAEVEKL